MRCSVRSSKPTSRTGLIIWRRWWICGLRRCAERRAIEARLSSPIRHCRSLPSCSAAGSNCSAAAPRLSRAPSVVSERTHWRIRSRKAYGGAIGSDMVFSTGPNPHRGQRRVRSGEPCSFHSTGPIPRRSRIARPMRSRSSSLRSRAAIGSSSCSSRRVWPA